MLILYLQPTFSLVLSKTLHLITITFALFVEGPTLLTLWLLICFNVLDLFHMKY